MEITQSSKGGVNRVKAQIKAAESGKVDAKSNKGVPQARKTTDQLVTHYLEQLVESWTRSTPRLMSTSSPMSS